MTALVAEGQLVDPRVFLFENDISAVRAFVDGLGRAGIQVAWARDSASGLALKARLMPEIALVGLDLPGGSLGLVRQLVEQRDCGVIVLAGRTDEADRISSLEIGADDFLSKPAAVRDMVARVRAVHRRVNRRAGPTAAEGTASVLTIGPIRINLQHCSVHALDGKRLTLTSAEYTALETLAQADGKPVSRDRLSEAALRRPWRAEDRSVDQLVFNLRQKLPADAGGGLMIQSIRGSGYWMRAPDRPLRQRPGFEWLADDMKARPAPELHVANLA